MLLGAEVKYKGQTYQKVWSELSGRVTWASYKILNMRVS